MKAGLFSLGIAVGAHPEVVRAIAENADRAGFSTLWVGEHVALFDHLDSRYPYSADGGFPLEPDADWLDPFITLTYAAAVTRKIRLGTGICLLPEHNPIVLAKEIASLDRLSGGRFAFGVGIGWSAEEFAALGIPFERRANRTREYVAAMRRLWDKGAASFHGEFLSFNGAYSFPKPVRGANLPVIFGGESDPALRRVADLGDGWYGFNCGPGEARERIAKLDAMLRERGRDPRAVEKIVAPYTRRVDADDMKRYRDAGVDEVVMLGNPPADPARVPEWIDKMASDWLEPIVRAG